MHARVWREKQNHHNPSNLHASRAHKRAKHRIRLGHLHLAPLVWPPFRSVGKDNLWKKGIYRESINSIYAVPLGGPFNQHSDFRSRRFGLFREPAAASVWWRWGKQDWNYLQTDRPSNGGRGYLGVYFTPNGRTLGRRAEQKKKKTKQNRRFVGLRWCCFDKRIEQSRENDEPLLLSAGRFIFGTHNDFIKHLNKQPNGGEKRLSEGPHLNVCSINAKARLINRCSEIGRR